MKSCITSAFLFLLLYSCKTVQHVHQQIFPAKTNDLIIPYHSLNNQNDLDTLINAIGDAPIVLLGEGSHGTSEYYLWRAEISRRLINEKRFNLIAVEGDWTDSYEVNKFIKQEKKDSNAVINLLKQYNRWPTWLWCNYETASLVEWLNDYNQKRSAKNKIGFYGLDLFNIYEAASNIIPYLKATDTAALNAVKRFLACFKPFADDEQQYRQTLSRHNYDCSISAKNLWRSVTKLIPSLIPGNENEFAIQQNALTVLDGEMYLHDGNAVDAWNFRDNHMAQTIVRLLKLYGANSKVIIWAHNNHVGASQFATMHWTGKVNLGQILRYEYGEKNVFIVGMGFYKGSVIAADKWGTAYHQMNVPPADDSSWEQRLHQINTANKLIISKELQNDPKLLRWFSTTGIGVIYHGNKEGIYSLSVIPKRYDAYLFFDNTNALHPIETPSVKGKTPPGDTAPDD